MSRVLNPDTADYPVRPESRERVLDAIERLNYRPNDLARALLHRRTNVVGLVVPDISNSYYSALAHGAEEAASSAGYRVILCNTDRSLEKTSTYLDTLVKSRVDGIIIAGGSTDARLSSQLFEPYGTKLVLVGRHDLPYPSVQIDNVGAAREATAYLLGLGHTALAFLAGPFTSHTVQDRLAGYRAALEEHGLPYDKRLIREGDFQEQSGYAAARSLLETGRRPTAVIAVNDRTAFGAMAALTDCGIRVPGDVSLVGFDDVPLASFMRPALTTVAIPSYEIGQAAMRILPGANSPEAPDRIHVLPTKLVVRASCASPSVRAK